jgi:N-acetylneuraminate synthase
MIKYIADIGSNHNQDFKRCKKLIEQAAKIGCWGVKFQLFKADKLYRNPSKKKLKELKISEFPIDWIPKIAECCDEHSIKFGCSPFYHEAVDKLEAYVDFYKISSFDILRENLIRKCIETDIPVIISLGLTLSSNFLKIKEKFDYDLRKAFYLHCISNYPALPEDCNLNLISLYNLDGWSDHTTEPGVIHQAVIQGAKIIEFHLDLEDKQGLEFKHGHCWTPSKISNTIRNIEIMQSSFVGSNFRMDLSQRADPKDELRPIKGYSTKNNY